MNDVLADIPFCIHVEQRAEGRRVVVVAGEADAYAAPELDRCVRGCVDGEVEVVVVDLTEATLLDSTALGVLLAARGHLAKQGIPLKLVCTNRLIHRVLTITGLDRVFDLYASPLEALDGHEPTGGNGKGGAAPEEASRATGSASES